MSGSNKPCKYAMNTGVGCEKMMIGQCCIVNAEKKRVKFHSSKKWLEKCN